MVKTCVELKEYLNLLEISNEDKKEFLERRDVKLYCYLRDTLTFAEILELETILKDIVNNVSDYENIDLSRFIKLKTDEVNKSNVIYDLDLLEKRDVILALSTIIILEPKNLILNYYNEL